MPKVIYNGNGSTSGSVPADNTTYNSGDTVTVRGNTGALTRSGETFASWNTAANGTGSVEFPAATFVIGAADVTLFAHWWTATGLSGGGTTTHYQFKYDSSLAGGGLEPGRTNTLIGSAEADFTLMKGWFGNIELSYSYPVSILVANQGGGASWGPPITLKGGGGNANLLRDLMVAEVTEMFMLAQAKGWFAPDNSNEQSSGEGLSHFLNEQFEIGDGRPPSLAFNAGIWLNSSLPSTNPASTRFGPPPTSFDYGARADFVNNILEYDHSNSPASGCSVLFLWYLFTQLGYTVPQIVQAAASTMGGVYKNLTGDAVDPFPFFKLLLDQAYPPDTASTVPAPNRDNPFPLALVAFWVDKNTFGKDEVQDVLNTHAGRFNNAFWLVVEGFSINTYNSLGVNVPAFTGAFANIPGLTITRSSTPVDFENPARPGQLQRIRIAFDITFTSASLAAFPATGTDPMVLELDGQVTVGGSTPAGARAATIFELTAGADPYFTNIDPSQNNVFWLSQDLRVFTAVPGKNNLPVAGGPVFNNDSVPGAFDYVTRLIAHLNTNFADPSGTDPFGSLIPGQGGALAGDSSVTPLTVEFNFPTFNIFKNYNFALARVRLRGLPGDVANDVKVFFRLWSTQTADTDFQPSTTYLSTQVGGRPATPLVGSGNRSIPFFASSNGGAGTDYAPGGPNRRNVALDIGDTKWAYFGCFLNVYDPGNVVSGQPIQALLNGTHHCLVAEIASADAPILNSPTVVLSPENSDKLAQRNLQVTTSDNPGGPASHRIPQTFDVRPSLALSEIAGNLLNYPDELMIDWGGTPVGSTAHIYWPQVNAADVLALSARLYGNHALTSADAHTIECAVTDGITYVPIPPGSGESFAGLLTVDLPTTVTAGQEFNVIVRRVTTRRDTTSKPVLNQPRTQTDDPTPSPNQPIEGAIFATRLKDQRRVRNWRYVTGTFQIKIPVGTPATLIGPERNTLAIMKWRLQQMSPANRWYLVMQRYVLYLSERLRELGVDPASIPASPLGFWEARPDERGGDHGTSHTGRIVEVIFGCNGRMEGFVLVECCETGHRFTACDGDLERIVLQACTQRYTVTVSTDTTKTPTGEHSTKVTRLIVRG